MEQETLLRIAEICFVSPDNSPLLGQGGLEGKKPNGSPYPVDGDGREGVWLRTGGRHVSSRLSGAVDILAWTGGVAPREPATPRHYSNINNITNIIVILIIFIIL